ncbi:MAG: septum formation initiator family protein [bacterium]|nr:septum formation initiator family protein [bacterium]
MSKSSGKNIKLIFVANIVVFCLVFFAFSREYLGNRALDREIRAYELRREALEQDRLASFELIEQLSSEYFLETEARTEYGLAAPGEDVIVFAETEPEATPIEPLRERSNPEKWFFYFFGE